MERMIKNRLAGLRSLIMFPFQLWLWAVSIPIRLAFYFVFGEFWRSSQMKQESKGMILGEKAKSSQSLPNRQQPLVRGETSVMNEPGRNVLQRNWENNAYTRPAPLQKPVEGTLTPADASVMYSEAPAQSEPTLIEVTFVTSENNLRSRPTSQSSRRIPVTTQHEQRPIVNDDERLPQFIQGEQIREKQESHHKQKAPQRMTQAASLKEEERLPTFIQVEQPKEKQESHKNIKIERNESAETQQLEDKRAARKHKRDLSLQEDAALKAQIDQIAHEKAELEAKLDEASRMHRNEATLLELNQREVFDLQQQNVILKTQAHEEALARQSVEEELKALQSRLEEVTKKQKAKQLRKKENKKKAAEAPKEQTKSAWADSGKKGFTEMVAEAQKEEKVHHTFAEVLKEGITEETVPQTKLAASEFTVVGGPESTKHVVESVNAK